MDGICGYIISEGRIFLRVNQWFLVLSCKYVPTSDAYLVDLTTANYFCNFANCETELRVEFHSCEAPETLRKND